MSAADNLYSLNQEKTERHKAHCRLNWTWTDTSILMVFWVTDVMIS